MTSDSDNVVRFSDDRIPFECDFPADFQGEEFDCRESHDGYTVKAMTDQLMVTIYCFHQTSVVTNPHVEEYLDALMKGRHPTRDCVTNGLPNTKEFPLPTPYLLGKRHKAYHVAIDFDPPGPRDHLLWVRCLLPKLKIQFQLSGDGEVADSIKRWLVILDSFTLKEKPDSKH